MSEVLGAAFVVIAESIKLYADFVAARDIPPSPAKADQADNDASADAPAADTQTGPGAISFDLM